MFTEASVSCNMSEILEKPNNEVLMKLLPRSNLSTEPIEECAQVFVQANIFNCGGIAISLCLFHKLMDATTFSCFLRSWASISKGSSDSSPKMVCSDYKPVSSLFPQTNSLPFHPQLHDFIFPSSNQKLCSRRFVFREKAILDLKAKAKSSEIPNPTCVETLTSFLWKHAMEAASTRTDSQRLSTLSHVVNLRKRMEPPLPEVSVGNILWTTVAHFSANETEVELSELVRLLRDSFAKVNNDYIKGLMGDGGTRAVFQLLGEINKATNYYFCTSWRNMNLNEVDFGWGKPIWIGMAGEFDESLTNILLLDSASGDGVEAWVILDEKEMELLEQNPQFLEFALLNPSIDLP